MRNIFTIFTAVSVCCLGLAVLVMLPSELKIQFGKRAQRPVTESGPNREFSEFYPNRRPPVAGTAGDAETRQTGSVWNPGTVTEQGRDQVAERQIESVAGGPVDSLSEPVDSPSEPVDSPLVAVSSRQAGEPSQERPMDDAFSGPDLTAEIRTAAQTHEESVKATPVSGITGAAGALQTGAAVSGNVAVVANPSLPVVEDWAASSDQLPAVAVPQHQTESRAAATGNSFDEDFAPDDRSQQQTAFDDDSVNALPPAASVATKGNTFPAVDSPAEFEVTQSGQDADTAGEDLQSEFQVVEEIVAEPVTAVATASEFSDSEPAESPAAAVQSLPVVEEAVERPSDSGPEFEAFPAETDQEDLFAMELEKTATALPAISSGPKSPVLPQAEQVAMANISRGNTGTLRPVPSSGEKDCGEGQVVEWNQKALRDRGNVSEEADFGAHLAETPSSPVTGTVKGTAKTPAAAAVAKSALVAEETDSDKVEILFDVSELASARGKSIREESPIVPVVHETSPSTEERLPTWDIPQRMTVKGPRRVLVPELEFEEWVNHGIPRGVPEHGGTLVRPFTPQPISPMRAAVARVRGSMEEAFERIPRLDFVMPRLISARPENSSGKRAGRPALATKSTVAAGAPVPGGQPASRVQPRSSSAAKPVVSGGRKITPSGGVVRAGWSTDEPASAEPRRISPPTAATGSQTQSRRLSPR